VAHCPPDLLDDLAEVFALLGTWAGVVQKTPGVFYLRREPFLHFHLLKGGAPARRREETRRLGRGRPSAADLAREPARAHSRTAGVLRGEARARPGAATPAGGRPAPAHAEPGLIAG
jgi:hypothetical protein